MLYFGIFFPFWICTKKKSGNPAEKPSDKRIGRSSFLEVVTPSKVLGGFFPGSLCLRRRNYFSDDGFIYLPKLGLVLDGSELAMAGRDHWKEKNRKKSGHVLPIFRQFLISPQGRNLTPRDEFGPRGEV
jgi:hypothetical protein